MKVLIATDGKKLEHGVARRFGKASWYMIVDVDTNDIELFPNLKLEDHHEIVPKASERGVSTIITGNIGPRSYDLISSLNLRVALARNMSARDAIERLKQGTLKTLDAPTLRRNLEAHEIIAQGRRWQAGKGGKLTKGKGGFATATPRGQHHLQQYGGRGH